MTAASSRAAITGAGVRVPDASSVDGLWELLLQGRSTATVITAFPVTDLATSFACQILDFEPPAFLSVAERRRHDRATSLALVAAEQAVESAGWHVPPERRAVVVGTGMAGVATVAAVATAWASADRPPVSPFAVTAAMPNATAAALSRRHEIRGPSMTVAAACAAGAVALGEALRLLRNGDADAVLAGGTEAVITPMVVAGFNAMDALSLRNDAPASASRPFDRQRDGFVLGEGAGFVMLEAAEVAAARGAAVLGELAGYGSSSDAHHVVAPDPSGRGAIRAMRQALEDAGIEPPAVGHVNAHGTSTKLNDRVEAGALAEVFGGAVPPVTAPKGVLGHLVGAAGAVEALAAVLAASRGVVPPTANHEEPDPDWKDLDVVAGQPRSIAPGMVLSNSFAFGGHNAALVLAPASS